MATRQRVEDELRKLRTFILNLAIFCLALGGVTFPFVFISAWAILPLIFWIGAFMLFMGWYASNPERNLVERGTT